MTGVEKADRQLGPGNWPGPGSLWYSFDEEDTGGADIPTHQEPESSSLLLGRTKLESTARYLGIEVDDALELAEQTDV